MASRKSASLMAATRGCSIPASTPSYQDPAGIVSHLQTKLSEHTRAGPARPRYYNHGNHLDVSCGECMLLDEAGYRPFPVNRNKGGYNCELCNEIRGFPLPLVRSDEVPMAWFGGHNQLQIEPFPDAAVTGFWGLGKSLQIRGGRQRIVVLLIGIDGTLRRRVVEADGHPFADRQEAQGQTEAIRGRAVQLDHIALVGQQHRLKTGRRAAEAGLPQVR